MEKRTGGESEWRFLVVMTAPVETGGVICDGRLLLFKTETNMIVPLTVCAGTLIV